MLVKKLPDISKFNKLIEDLSPSNYGKIILGCSFPLVVHRNFKMQHLDWSLLLPSFSKSSYLGIIIHKLCQERVQGLILNEDEYVKKWEYYICKKENEIKNNYPSIRNVSLSDYDKMYESCESIMKLHPCNKSNISTLTCPKHTLEVKLSIPGLITGVIDRLKFHDDYIEIIDYKSGAVFDKDGLVDRNIILQLNLYALCCEHNYQLPVKKLTVIQTCNSSEVNIPLMKEKFPIYLEQIKKKKENINSLIKERNLQELQILDNESCNFCDCRHMCLKYLNSDFRSEFTVDGIVTDINNKNFLSLQNFSGDNFSISKMQNINIENWNSLLHKHLIFINVSSRIDNVYRITDKTLIFELP